MKKIITFLLTLLCLGGLAVTASAQELSSPELVQECTGLGSADFLFDGDLTAGQPVPTSTEITLTSQEGIASLYLIYDGEYAPCTLTDGETGAWVICGEEGFLHDYLDLAALFGRVPSSVILTVGNQDTRMTEIRVFGPGEIPEDVQRWSRAPEGEVDLMVLSAHGDDEQLFFSGVLPDYAGQRGYETLVVYLTDHRNNAGYLRCHEMLNGLWAVGVTDYPVFGSFPDFYSLSLEQAYGIYANNGIEKEDLLGFVVEQLRKYRPMVALTHDVNGEYGHGMHRMCAQLLQEAVEISMDPRQYPESGEQYGLWEVPKTYLHQYPENPVVMDWDQPLDRFGGMTAFQVTKELGFPAHVSQYRDFAWYAAGFDRASEIPENGPCCYGLYRTTVGPDEEKNDFFENVLSHREQREEQAWLELERLEQEEKARLEQEERERLEQERRREAAAQATAESVPEEPTETTEILPLEPIPPKLTTMRLLILDSLALLSLVLLLILLVSGRNRRKKK